MEQVEYLKSMAPKSIRIQATKLLRAQERRKVGKLRDQVVSVRTRERYKLCFDKLCRFAGLRTNFDVASFSLFDTLVADYLEYLWESGDGKAEASYSLAAIQFYRPQTKQHLPEAWKLVKFGIRLRFQRGPHRLL